MLAIIIRVLDSSECSSPVILNGFSLPSLGSSFRIKPSNSTSIADSVVFYYLGRHNRVKNIPRLIESFYLLKENYSNFKLLIAGFELDSECQYLRDIVSRLNLESHVFFVGFQERPLDFLSKLDFVFFLVIVKHYQAFSLNLCH